MDDEASTRLALLPPGAPSAWWAALLDGLVAADPATVLWVAAEPPADERVRWLPTGTGGAGVSPPLPPTGPLRCAAVIVDPASPRASAVIGLGDDVLLVAVLGDGEGRRVALPDPVVERAGLLVCTDVSVGRNLPAGLRDRMRIVPLGLGDDQLLAAGERIRSTDAVAGQAGPVHAPVVAVTGGPLTPALHEAWGRLSARWPEAILLADLDELPAARRLEVLARAHVAVVLDPADDRLAEAMAAGVTVVAHGDAYASAVVVHGLHGLLTDARSPDLLETTLTYAVEYHAQLAPVRRGAQERVRAVLNSGTLAGRLLEAIADTAAAHGSARPRHEHDRGTAPDGADRLEPIVG